MHWFGWIGLNVTAAKTWCHKPACSLCNNVLYCTIFDLQVQIIDLWHSR